VIAFMRWILESEDTLSTTDESIQDSLQQIFNPSSFFPSRSNYVKSLRLELRAMADELKQKWLDEKEQKRLRRLNKKAKAAALAQAASGEEGAEGGDVITPAAEQSTSSSSTDDDDSKDSDNDIECLPGNNTSSSHHLNQSSINVDIDTDTDDDHQYAYEMAADYSRVHVQVEEETYISLSQYGLDQHETNDRMPKSPLPLDVRGRSRDDREQKQEPDYDLFTVEHLTAHDHRNEHQNRERDLDELEHSSSSQRAIKRKHNTLFQNLGQGNKHTYFDCHEDDNDASDTGTLVDDASAMAGTAAVEGGDDDDLDLKHKQQKTEARFHAS
jgi:hypothetical protein